MNAHPWVGVVLFLLAFMAASYAVGFIGAAIADGPVWRDLRARIFEHFAAELVWIGYTRKPDFIVGSQEDPYLLRWWLFGSKPHPKKPGTRVSRSILGVRAYLHCFKRSDDDRAHHDHPQRSVSVVCEGGAIEHTIAAGGIHQRRQLCAGDVRWRRAEFAHRIEIPAGGKCWTLFVFFGGRREWGFHCPERGWVPWYEFTDPSDAGMVGPGCEA